MPAVPPIPESVYSEEIVDKLCTRLADGESLRSICNNDDMPCKATILKWIFVNKDNKYTYLIDQYTLARQMQAELMADEIIDISDDGRNDFMERKESKSGEIYYVTNNESVQRSKLRSDNRKWVSSRLLSKYRDKAETKVTIDAAGDFLKAIQPTTGLPTDRDDSNK